jgi:voltage-gated potassium channel
MDKVLFLFLRRMRAPLLALMAAYSDLHHRPGADTRAWTTRASPGAWISSMPSTSSATWPRRSASARSRTPSAKHSGCGPALTIFLSVIAWLYAIGKILSLLQDQTFRLAVSQQAFDRSIRRLRAPFLIVCGYGDTGSLLVRALLQRRKRVVVIDAGRSASPTSRCR